VSTTPDTGPGPLWWVGVDRQDPHRPGAREDRRPRPGSSGDLRLRPGPDPGGACL